MHSSTLDEDSRERSQIPTVITILKTSTEEHQKSISSLTRNTNSTELKFMEKTVLLSSSVLQKWWKLWYLLKSGYLNFSKCTSILLKWHSKYLQEVPLRSYGQEALPLLTSSKHLINSIQFRELIIDCFKVFSDTALLVFTFLFYFPNYIGKLFAHLWVSFSTLELLHRLKTLEYYTKPETNCSQLSYWNGT